MTTKDDTLRRKCSVTDGDINPAASYDPGVEWDGFSMGDFSDLGQYSCP